MTENEIVVDGVSFRFARVDQRTPPKRRRAHFVGEKTITNRAVEWGGTRNVALSRRIDALALIHSRGFATQAKKELS